MFRIEAVSIFSNVNISRLGDLKMKKIILTAFFLLISRGISNANVSDIIKRDYEQGDFKLVYDNIPAGIFHEADDYKVVEIAADLLAADIEKVTGIKPAVNTSMEQISGNVVIVGTIGRSKLIDKLIEEGKINAADITGKWETYALQVVEKPLPNIDIALVIFGSDRRAAAYGVFELSEQIGVSPWYWWADVPVQKKENIIIKEGYYRDGPPSVKYRGIFINDEDWGLKPWATMTYDPELGDIGPKTYRKVFELLLRLKANHCWPAMHSCTKPFNYYPENKQVADDYAIVMGSAHCEPLLFNNASEWDSGKMGKWRYDTNRENIYRVLDNRVLENGRFENVYTVGLRGIHDAQMEGGLSIEDQIALLEKVFIDQREILTKHIDKEVTEIPQVFIPYKEVMTLYDNGLEVPEDVTLMWVDDNFGYIRRLSNPLERKRPGGAGIYYHLSYLGPPHEYLWLYSTPPALVWEEMTKAYRFNARRVWIANVGDIKPCEYGISFFLDLAWDINVVDHTNVSSHLSQWLESIFGREHSQELTEIMREYYALAFERKPEFMGFGEQFSSENMTELWEDTEFSFVNYREAEKRLGRFQAISDRAAGLYENIPEHLKPAYFQLVYYPVVAGNYMNSKILLAQKNRWYAQQARNSTNDIARLVKENYDNIKTITEQYDLLLDGKWKYMMSWRQHDTASYYLMPPVKTIDIPEQARMGIFVEGDTPNNGIDYTCTLPCFNSVYQQEHFFEIYNKGNKPFKFKATPVREWIKLSHAEGQVTDEQRIFVSIDWSRVPQKEIFKGAIQVEGAGREETIHVNCFNPTIPAKDELKDLFVENDGIVSIAAENYNRKVESAGISFDIIDDLGQTGKSVIILPVTAGRVNPWVEKSPHLEYDIYTHNSGVVEIHSYVLPVFPINSFRAAQYGISIDREPRQIIDFGVPEYSAQWADNVRRNASVNITRHYINKPGKHTLKLWMVDTGMTFDRIIIDLGGLKMSYLGPDETRMP